MTNPRETLPKENSIHTIHPTRVYLVLDLLIDWLIDFFFFFDKAKRVVLVFLKVNDFFTYKKITLDPFIICLNK